MAPWPDHAEAVRRAAVELKALGFSEDRPSKYSGRLLDWQQQPITVRVNLPPEFPFVVPDVFVSRDSLPNRVPHIEASGKICLVRSGCLLDVSNPEGLVRDALERARAVVRRGLARESEDDFIAEFMAYWGHEAETKVWSICNVNGPPRLVWLGHLADWPTDGATLLVADDSAAAEAWASRLGRAVSSEGEAYFVPLDSVLMPPDFGERLHFGPFCEEVVKHISAGTADAVRSWLKIATLPARVILSMATPSPSSPRVAFLVGLPAVSSGELKAGGRGFRAGKGPTEREIGFRRHRGLVKGAIQRADAAYLLPRTGDSPDLVTSRVAIAGCGAVGSQVASFLVGAGVGDVLLIDNEKLDRQNVHRHVLGIDSVGKHKASALARLLKRKFPHLKVEHRDEDVNETLRIAPDVLEHVDLVIVAVGNETLQLQLEDRLASHVRRIHVWLEPLGLAQHVFLSATANALGCYGCLFERDEDGVLHNGSSLAAAGQDFDRTIAGCQDAFFPFSGVDAAHAALMAVETAVRVLRDPSMSDQLQTRVGGTEAFTAAGFKQSSRGVRLQGNQTHRVVGVGRRDCQICGTHA